MNVTLRPHSIPIKPLPTPTEELNLNFERLLGNFPVSQVEGWRCTLLAGSLFISLARSEEQIKFSQQCLKMFKIASDIFIHAFLLFLGLFLKIFRWVSLSWGRKRVGRETLWTTSWGWGGDLENVFSDDEPCFGRKLVGSIPQGFLIGLPLSNRLYNSKETKEYKFYIIKAC